MERLMKGHVFAKHKHKMNYPAVCEVKYDEIRCDVQWLHSHNHPCFMSYANKPLHNLNEFADQFGGFMLATDHMRLDCGVLVNRSFDDTYRYVRSSTGTPDDLRNASVEFVLFDLPANTWPFSQRRDFLDAMAKVGRERYGIPFIRPLYSVVQSEAEVWDTFSEARERGYEGLMVKSLDHTYQLDKRIYGWLKVKPEDDADGRIVRINRAVSIEGVPLDRAGSVGIECEDGSECDAAGIPHELGRLMLAHPEQFIGQWASFTYMERDRQGGYRHPRFQRIREAKA